MVDRLGQFSEAMQAHASPATALGAVTAGAAVTALPVPNASAQNQPSSSSATSTSTINLQALPGIQLAYVEEAPHSSSSGAGSKAPVLLSLSDLAVVTPDRANLLVQGLHLQVSPGTHACTCAHSQGPYIHLHLLTCTLVEPNGLHSSAPHTILRNQTDMTTKPCRQPMCITCPLCLRLRRARRCW